MNDESNFGKKEQKSPTVKKGIETELTHLGRWPDKQFGIVNTPVYRASTVLHPDLKTLTSRSQPFSYGRRGTPSSQSVEEIVTALENGAGTKLTSSGLSAIACALMSVVKSGDEILVVDCSYEPTRQFCDGYLAKMGVKTQYFSSGIGENISELIKQNTVAIMLESPGSHTFEIQDLPAIRKACGDKKVAIIIDNTWATPLYYQPLQLGADISVHAGTKMFVGHSDAMFGTITANDEYFSDIEQTHGMLGLFAGPDDCFLAARGLRTLAIRMKEHQNRALEIADWLQSQELVERVLHPALSSHPDHALFKRDFTGSGSLFSFVLPASPGNALAALLDHMELFGIGYSWGGFESLILPSRLDGARSVSPWPSEKQLIRLHIGLEDINDLKGDLSAALDRYRAAMQ